MVNIELVNYISSNLRRGLSYSEIHSQLLRLGFSDFDISEAVNYMNKGETQNNENNFEIKKNVNLKGFVLAFFILLVVVAIFILFLFLFRDIGEKSVLVKEESLKQGVYVELAKKSVLEIEFDGKVNKFNVLESQGVLDFSNVETSFSLIEGESKEIDFNSDGLDDVFINFTSSLKNRIFIESFCREEWDCSEFSPCLFGKQSRVCIDLNSCSTEVNKPLVEIDCTNDILESYNVSDGN
ncbi:hypothetical protein GW932_05100 [archaeon]|nr:hypothetical protein [archaeon]